MSDVVRTERGWAGHYICANYCRFRRNTLIEHDDKKWVISTVGGMVVDEKFQEIGYRRWFETMAFVGEEKDGYIDADVTQKIDFESECGIWGDSWEQVISKFPDVDNVANNMHEKVVTELIEKIQSQ